MVLRLVQKKKRKQYVLKKREDAFNKGERQAEGEKQSPVGMESKVEGDLGTKSESSKAAEKATEVETSPATETKLSREEIEISEILVKAKLDTPKATPKAKGVVIKEVGLEKKRKEISVEEAKKKGKEKEEETQSAKDREIALEMAAKLNEEYQKSLKFAAAAKKVTKKASRQRLPLKTRQRQPSKTYLANQERRKMINFLKEAIGVPEGMFTSMSFGKLEELCQKEMAKLKGDSTQREEDERKMKERHDLNIQQPFPESEEETPIKEKKEEKKEETLAHQIGVIKRKKTIATKPKAKRARIEEERAEVEQEPTDEPLAEPEQSNQKEYFRFKRMGDQFEVYATWGKIIRSCSRSDLEEMFKIGMSMYENVLTGEERSLIRLAMEYLCMMFDPSRVQHVVRDLHLENKFQRKKKWMLFERCGVYVITVDRAYHEYYLVDKIYDHSKAKLQGMLNAKLICSKDSEMARIVVRRILNQSLGLDPNLGN
ncbi:hypothetical protein L6452_18311 [Arctium lappa]|uniref:Uncharacterized protein n=1 Tax=Arctium lappa TaxID=4217 RepID=A0ACB9C5T1_ARCLA|nr:hypothetical protein L6452_18311 [Arctium lappa]